MDKSWYIFLGACGVKQGSPPQGLNWPISLCPVTGQGKPPGSPCWQTKRIRNLCWQDPTAQVQQFSGHNPQEGADLAAKLHSSDVTGGFLPWLYSAARCNCRYMHQLGHKCLFGGLCLTAEELWSVKQSGILQRHRSLVVTCSIYSNQWNILP